MTKFLAVIGGVGVILGVVFLVILAFFGHLQAIGVNPFQ